MSQRILVSSLIVLGLWTFTAFSSALQNGLVNWDDPLYLEFNRPAQRLDLVGIFSDDVAANYQPLSVLSLAVERRVFGMRPFVFHLVNVLLHVANTLLVALLVLRLVPGRRFVALASAALFGLHPIHVESVAWVSERKDVLSVFFVLLSLLAYLAWVDRGGRRAYALSLGAFALALLSKPMAVSVPVVLLSLDLLRGRGLGARRWLEKLPFFAGAIAAGIANLRLQSPDVIRDLSIYRLDWLERLRIAVEGIVFYFAKTLWPTGLSAVYDIDLVRIGAFEWALALGATLLLAVWAARTPGLRREAAWGVAFFGITIALVLKLIPFGAYSLYNDRYMYLPSVGLFLAFALPFADAVRWRPVLRAAAIGGWLLMLALLSLQTHARCAVWRSSETLWRDVLARYPDSVTALNNLGQYYLGERDASAEDLDAARALFERASALHPESPGPYYNLGRVSERRGDREAAARYYERALALNPDEGTWGIEVARFYASGGDFARAVRHYEQVVVALPGHAELYHNLGDLYRHLGQTGRARTAYEQALALDPDLGPTHAALGRIYLEQGNERRALAAFERAVAEGTRVDPAVLRRLRARHPPPPAADSSPAGAGDGL